MQSDVYHTRINAQGRLVLPAPARKALGVRPGEDLIVRVEPDGIKITTPRQSLQRAQALFAAVAPPDVVLSDELIRDRRAEVARD